MRNAEQRRSFDAIKANYANYLKNLSEGKREKANNAINKPFTETARAMRELFPFPGEAIDLVQEKPMFVPNNQNVERTILAAHTLDGQGNAPLGDIWVNPRYVHNEPTNNRIGVMTLNAGNLADGDYPGWKPKGEEWKELNNARLENTPKFFKYLEMMKESGMKIINLQDIAVDSRLFAEIADKLGYMVVSTSTMTHDPELSNQPDQRLVTLIDTSILKDGGKSAVKVDVIPHIQYLDEKHPGNGPVDWSVANPGKGELYEPGRSWFMGHTLVTEVALVDGSKMLIGNNYQCAASNHFQRTTNTFNALEELNALAEKRGAKYKVFTGDENYQGDVSQVEPLYGKLPPYPFALVDHAPSHFLAGNNPTAREELGYVLDEVSQLEQPWIAPNIQTVKPESTVKKDVSTMLPLPVIGNVLSKLPKSRRYVGIVADHIFVPYGTKTTDHLMLPNEFSDHNAVILTMLLGESDTTSLETYQKRYRNIERLARLKERASFVGTSLVEIAAGALVLKAGGRW